MFQFTLPCRERRADEDIEHLFVWFQFTLPCRERPLPEGRRVACEMFQFTLPCRERQGLLGGEDGAMVRFNSRSRVGSDTLKG